jgi:hypothetical protein
MIEFAEKRREIIMLYDQIEKGLNEFARTRDFLSDEGEEMYCRKMTELHKKLSDLIQDCFASDTACASK